MIAALDPKQRGYSVVYKLDETNHCPGCGRTHWYLGRTLVECAFCATALPYAEPLPSSGHSTVTRRNHHIPAAVRGRFTINGRAG